MLGFNSLTVVKTQALVPVPHSKTAINKQCLHSYLLRIFQMHLLQHLRTQKCKGMLKINKSKSGGSLLGLLLTNC